MSVPERARGTRLEPIVADVVRRSAARRRALPLAELRRTTQALPARRERFVEALRRDRITIIAECKRRSPSAGELGGEDDLLPRARAYASGGASAISVLTEEDHFRGSLADLAAVEPAGLPRLRKDFVVDEGMVLEAASFGADALLLLPVILDDGLLAELRTAAREVGLAALVEVHDEAELERALAVEPDLVGVNARDLRTFEVDLATTERLLPQMPPSVVRVAESGIRERADLERVRAAGADAALVGEALMAAPDPEALLRTFTS